MNLGQLLGGAGVVANSMRQAEEGERLARQNQLAIEERNRLNQLRKEMLQAPMPTPAALPQFMSGDTGALPVQFAGGAQPTGNFTGALGAQPTGAGTSPVAQAFPVAPPSTLQTSSVPPITSTMTQTDADRLALLKAPTAALDVIQAPAAGALNLVTMAGEQVINVGGRLINAITGREVAPTDVQGPRFGMTPFYDKYVRQPEQAATDTAQARQRAGLTPTPNLPDPQRLLAAMTQVESGGDPNAVSSAGATGLMQVKPSTAMSPGFGLPSIFDFAQQLGLQVGARTEAEASRLLKNPSIGAPYGQQYMNAMLQRYNNNLDYALVAYNWGPGNADKWLAKGADFTKLPKETRDYIPKVMAALGPQAAPTAAPTAGAPAPAAPPQAGLTMPGMPTVQTAPTTPAIQPPAQQQQAQAPTQAQPQAQAPAAVAAQPVEVRAASDFYLANPQSVPLDMQRAMQQRGEVERLAGMYQRAGMGMEFMQTRAKLMEIDNGMTYLQGMQGLQEFSLANDPRRLAAVWSQYAGVPVGIQPRTDGKYDIVVNGRKTKTGVTASDIADSARSAFDQTYRQQKGAASAQYNMETFKAQLDVQKNNAQQLSQMIREIAVERVKGNNQQALEWAKANYGWDIKPTGSGDGTVIIRAPGAQPFIFNPSGRTIEVDGVKITSNAAYPIAGLPTYGGVKP